MTIQNCRHALVENAIINRLNIENSSVTILKSIISGSGTAINVANSSLSITASRIIGRTGIATNNTRLDIAGSTFVVSDNVITAEGATEIVFSLVRSEGATLSEKSFHETSTMQRGDTL